MKMHLISELLKDFLYIKVEAIYKYIGTTVFLLRLPAGLKLCPNIKLCSKFNLNCLQEVFKGFFPLLS